MAAGAPQPRDLGQNVDLALAGGVVGQVLDPLHGTAPQGFVQGALVVVEIDQDRLFRPRRQFSQHRRFGPAQDEGADQGLQGLLGRLVAALDRQGEALAEAFQEPSRPGLMKWNRLHSSSR